MENKRNEASGASVGIIEVLCDRSNGYSFKYNVARFSIAEVDVCKILIRYIYNDIVDMLNENVGDVFLDHPFDAYYGKSVYTMYGIWARILVSKDEGLRLVIDTDEYIKTLMIFTIEDYIELWFYVSGEVLVNDIKW